MGRDCISRQCLAELTHTVPGAPHSAGARHQPNGHTNANLAMKLELKEDWLVGHGQIDNEHRELIEILNSLTDMLDEGLTEQAVAGFKHFFDKLQAHFASETLIMNNCFYIYTESHSQHHSEALTKLKNDWNGGECDYMDFMSELVTVVVKDLLLHDLHFRDHLITSGYTDSK